MVAHLANLTRSDLDTGGDNGRHWWDTLVGYTSGDTGEGHWWTLVDTGGHWGTMGDEM